MLIHIDSEGADRNLPQIFPEQLPSHAAQLQEAQRKSCEIRPFPLPRNAVSGMPD
jgi:hypothetical protein